MARASRRWRRRSRQARPKTAPAQTRSTMASRATRPPSFASSRAARMRATTSGSAAQRRRRQVGAQTVAHVGQEKRARIEANEFRFEVERHGDRLVPPLDPRAHPTFAAHRLVRRLYRQRRCFRREADLDIERIGGMLRIDRLILIDRQRGDPARGIPRDGDFELRMAFAKDPLVEELPQVSTRGDFDRANQIDCLNRTLRVILDIARNRAPERASPNSPRSM